MVNLTIEVPDEFMDKLVYYRNKHFKLSAIEDVATALMIHQVNLFETEEQNERERLDFLKNWLE